MSDLIELDPGGDVILSVTNPDNNILKTFLASSVVLGLASPVLANLLGPILQKDAIKIENGNRPTVSLQEDDPNVMEMLLRLLHHKSDKTHEAIDPKTLAVLADHCDKYSCRRALRPWIQMWCSESDLTAKSTAEDYGYMLQAAYVFEADSFSRISKNAMLNLVPGFASKWKEEGIMARLPKGIDDALTSKGNELRDTLQEEIQFLRRELRDYNTGYTMGGMVCASCGDMHDEETEEDDNCISCGKRHLRPRMCSTESRISEYIKAMEDAKIWPSVKTYKSLSVSDIASRLATARSKVESHECGARGKCPLMDELDDLTESVSGFILESEGIARPQYKRSA